MSTTEAAPLDPTVSQLFSLDATKEAAEAAATEEESKAADEKVEEKAEESAEKTETDAAAENKENKEVAAKTPSKGSSFRLRGSKVSSAKAKEVVASVKKSTGDDAKKSSTAPRVVRNKSFKRIRGLLKGGSRREKKSVRAGESSGEKMSDSRRAELAAAAGGGESGDDSSTIYNVTVDDRSVATSTAMGDVDLPKIPEANEKYLLRMVLLLMDVGTRRFELLQLEFDSEKALVSDVLTQVPVSVTEQSLRGQKYVGIVTADGEDMPPEKALSDFCHGNDVLVAVPEGLSPKDAARLSKPILQDPKVVGMLKSSGVDANDWGKKTQEPGESPTGDSKEKKDDKWSSRQVPDYGATSKSSKPSGLTIGAIVIVLIAIIAGLFHSYSTAAIAPGESVPPGTVLKDPKVKSWGRGANKIEEDEDGKAKRGLFMMR